MAIIARARTLRKTMTPAETRLWLRLRELRDEGLHFRRQAPRRGYILDFVCLDRGVIVEVDGASHNNDDRARKDRVRDAILAREGFVTLRYSNEAVQHDVDRIVHDVRMRCRTLPTRLARRANHPPPEGEGEPL